jgi:hypothetical protein
MESDTFSRLTATQKLIAIYIVLNANHEPGIWYDKYKNIEVNIDRGQLVVSRNKIANEWFKNDKDVSEQKVRTCLTKLEKLGFLTKSTNNDYTLLTVRNYSVYQQSENEENDEVNQVLTKHQPSLNQASTTNKNVKNEKNEKKKDNSPKFEICDEESAKLLFKLMQKNNDSAKEPKFDKWADEIRLIRERDNKTTDQINALIEFSQNDDFWKSNVLSPAKLRKNWDMLVIKYKQHREKRNEGKPSKPYYPKGDQDDERSNGKNAKENGRVRLYK